MRTGKLILEVKAYWESVMKYPMTFALSQLLIDVCKEVIGTMRQLRCYSSIFCNIGTVDTIRGWWWMWWLRYWVSPQRWSTTLNSLRHSIVRKIHLRRIQKSYSLSLSCQKNTDCHNILHRIWWFKNWNLTIRISSLTSRTFVQNKFGKLTIKKRPP